MIFHITPADAWRNALENGLYTAPSLDSEGFIHCSTAQQILWVANRFYHGQSDLLLLVIDPDKLAAPLRYEESEPGRLFPHLYGPLNLDAVIQALAFPPSAEGSFTLPGHLGRDQEPTNLP